MDKKFYNPKVLAGPRGYTHTVQVINPSQIIAIAGQVALDGEGNIVGLGNIEAQTRKVFENLKVALQAAGASFEDVIKVNIYATEQAGAEKVRAVRNEYFQHVKNPPASTLVVVSSLFRKELLVEIEVWAVK